MIYLNTSFISNHRESVFGSHGLAREGEISLQPAKSIAPGLSTAFQVYEYIWIRYLQIAFILPISFDFGDPLWKARKEVLKVEWRYDIGAAVSQAGPIGG